MGSAGFGNLSRRQSGESGDEMQRFHGFRQASLESAFERLFAHGVARKCRDRDGRHGRLAHGFLGLANLAQEREAVDDGKTKIAHDDVGPVALEHIAGGRCRVDGVDLGTGLDENGGERAAGRGGVFDQKHMAADEEPLEMRTLAGGHDALVRILGSSGQANNECCA